MAASTPSVVDDLHFRAEPGGRMGGAVGRRDHAPAGHADSLKPRRQIAQQRGFAPLQVGGSGDVDRQPVRRVGLADGGVAVHRPEGEAVQGVGVSDRIGVPDVKVRNEGLGLGRGDADTRAASGGGGVAGRDDPLAAEPAGQDECAIRRRRVGAQPSAQPLDGPVRQEERDDPSHRKRPE